VEGNFIGLRANGTQSLANILDGATIELGADDNVIGGTSGGARNVISGNLRDGVSITDAGTVGNLVQGNYIGPDVTGAIAVANHVDGVSLGSVGNHARRVSAFSAKAHQHQPRLL